MEKMIAYCGIDCAGCEAYIATQANDHQVKLALLEKWRAAYNSPEMTISAVTCDGCTSQGRLGGYTQECPVYACGRERGVANCAHCDDFSACETLLGFVGNVPEALDNLKAIRASL